MDTQNNTTPNNNNEINKVNEQFFYYLMFDKSEIGLYLLQSNLQPFSLKVGMVVEVIRLSK